MPQISQINAKVVNDFHLDLDPFQETKYQQLHTFNTKNVSKSAKKQWMP